MLGGLMLLGGAVLTVRRRGQRS
ncbi:hypothetical protein [Microbacterium sp.]